MWTGKKGVDFLSHGFLCLTWPPQLSCFLPSQITARGIWARLEKHSPRKKLLNMCQKSGVNSLLWVSFLNLCFHQPCRKKNPNNHKASCFSLRSLLSFVIQQTHFLKWLSWVTGGCSTGYCFSSLDLNVLCAWIMYMNYLSKIYLKFFNGKEKIEWHTWAFLIQLVFWN